MREVAALLLAGVFLVAGGAKLFDTGGTRRSVRELGLPLFLGWPVAIALPVLELTLAAGLVVQATSRASAAAAACLLAAFAGVVGLAAIRGRAADCGCFGQLHSSKAGYPAAARSGALALLALLLAATSAGRIGWVELVVALSTAVLLAHGLVWLALLRRYGRALRRIEELEAETGETPLAVGAEVPQFRLPDANGALVALRDLVAVGRPVLVAFVDSECGPCRSLIPEIAAWQRDLAARLTVAVVARGDAEANRPLAEEHGIRLLLAEGEPELLDLYGVTASPSAVLIGRDGRLHGPMATGVTAIRKLVQSFEPPATASASTSPADGLRPRTAVIAAAGAVAAVPGAHAAETGVQAEAPSDPELRAFERTIETASPALAKAARRSSESVRRAIIFEGGSRARAKRAAAAKPLAAKALDAERAQVLALRTRLERLPATSERARNVKVSALAGLLLLAQSLRTRKKAVIAAPAAAERLFAESERLFLRALDWITTSAQMTAEG